MVSSVMQIISKPVPSFATGRKGHRPEAIVIHNLNSTCEDAFAKFQDPNFRQSMHYIVCENGKIFRTVSESDTAWHSAGIAKPSWEMVKKDVNPNLYTIGIGHEAGFGKQWNTDIYRSSARLIARICERWDIEISPKSIIPHSDINSLNFEDDPGLGVDFAKLIAMAKSIHEGQDEHEHLKERIRTLEQTQEVLLNKLSTIQLNYVALTSENKNLKLKLPKVISGNDESQSRILSEELYELQQENRQLRNEMSNMKPERSEGFIAKLSKYLRNLF